MPKLSEVMAQQQAQAAAPAGNAAPRRVRLSELQAQQPEPLEIVVEPSAPQRAAQAIAAAPKPAPAAAAPKQRTTGQRIVREVGGLGLRNIVEGAADLAGIFYDPIADGVNWLGSKGPTTKTLITGQEERYFPRQRRAREISDLILDSAGVPKPETPQERVAGDVGRGLTGTALTMGLGGLLSGGKTAAEIGAQPTIQQAVGNFLTGQPVSQVVSTATGAASAGTAREAGLGPGGQAVAGILGAMAPGAGSMVIPRIPRPGSVPAATAAATRAVLRGRDEAGRKLTAEDINQTIKDFAAGGTTGSVGQVGQSRVGQALETMLGSLPGGAGRIDKFGKQQARQVGDRIEEVAEELTPRGARMTPEDVGEQIVADVSGGGRGVRPDFKERTRQAAGRMYDKLDEFIDPESRVGAETTAKTLPELNPTIPGAPNLSPLFQNARIRNIENAFERDAWGNEAVATRPGMADQVADARGTLKDQADDIGRLNSENAEAIARQNVLRTSLGQKPLEHVDYPVMGRKDIDDEIQALLAGKADGKLPFQALKKLRTAVGQEIDNAGLMSDVPRSKWTALYAALSDDMKAAAEQAGPQAMKAWERANTYWQLRIKRLEHIEHVINRNAKGGPEAVWQAATSNTKYGATTLRNIMHSLERESRKELSAMFIRRLGRATKGQQNADSDKFSMATFLSNWSDISPEAKKVLFDQMGPGYRENIERISRMAERVKEGAEVFRNPSGTGRLAALLTQTVGAGTAAATTAAQGNVAAAVVALSAAAGTAGMSNVLARAMTNPKWVSWLAANTTKPTGELLAQLQVISRVGEKDGDDDIVAAARALQQAAATSPAQ
ncbi:hypothetical protein ACI2IY_05645 [Lysobacter enzymogenes]|uniref:hypothetical protein n=1 Tax=Lysobacter enzymogenes TaxID=69 RepID=UPI00385051E6